MPLLRFVLSAFRGAETHYRMMECYGPRPRCRQRPGRASRASRRGVEPGRGPHLVRVGRRRSAAPAARSRRARGPWRARPGSPSRCGEVVAQPAPRPAEAVAVEGEGRGVAGRQLGGVQVPPLVVPALERAAHQAEVQLPARAHGVGVADRQDVGRPVRQPHAGAGRGRLHDELGVVGDRVGHALVLRGDPAERRVVVGAVVQRRAPPVGGVDHPRDQRRAVRAEDRLRRLHLDLEAQPADAERPPRAARRRSTIASTWSTLVTFGRRDDSRRAPPAVGAARWWNATQRPQARAPGGRLEALDPDAAERRARCPPLAGRERGGGRGGIGVLGFVAACAP